MKRAWAQAQRSESNCGLAVNKLLTQGLTSLVLKKKLEVCLGFKFPVVIKEKLGLEEGSIVFFIGLGLKKWARSTSRPDLGENPNSFPFVWE